ncbi:DUF5114 domain-containing protein [Bacteroides caecigallinarum]|uniref:DUF5114 domain-containing protein n=1 Tax=Bacteroides caecigallinarum TaxID=1411144 RepID=UPI0019591222|nr:DUF5114 domain-containing protein [Bacteroides caecigallinarum]MBM6864513.1 DUF5114 domain-containing protein [Bacteroides caecigallinarum]
MKTLNKILLTLASILALISCEKDGEKIYLQSLGSDELIATTDKVVLSVETSQKVVLSFAWKGQDVQINDTTVGTAAKAKNYMEISLSEDFSGQIYKDETTSNSTAYKGGELNSIVNGLGAKVGEVNNVFFRLGSATGENIPYAYSNVVKVDVTPYVMDMNTGVLLAADKTENGKTLYSENADGIYKGFLGIKKADKNFWLKEGDGSIWGNIADSEKAFVISSDPSNQWNFWFPDIAGCYYTVIDTQEEEWSATLLSTVTISGDIQGDMNFDVENNHWILNYKSDAAKDINITLSGTSKIFNATTGSVDGTPDTFGFANSNDGLLFGKTSDNITLHVEEGENSIILYMNVSEELPHIVATNDATEIPSTYPATVDVQRWDGTAMVSMVILKRTDSENGIYEGTYDGAYLKNDEHYGFEFIADETWYRADANDNTKLAISNDNLSKFFFDKADDNVTSINVTITVNLNKLSWSYVINSQEPGEGEDEGDETYPDILYMVKWVAADQPYNILLTLNESETPGIYTGNYTGTGNPSNFSFIDPKETQASDNQIRDDGTWVWYGKESDAQLYKLKENGFNLWFASPYWSESNVNYTITVDLTQMSWSITNNN